MTKNLTFLNFFKNLSKSRAEESVQTLSSSAGELQVNKGYGLRPLRGPSEGRKEPKMAKIIKVLSFWAAAQKGTMSCRTQGDFCSFVRSYVHVSRFEPQGCDLSLKLGFEL